MLKDDLNKAVAILARFIESSKKGFVRISCEKHGLSCEDGTCKATIRKNGDSYELVTGIVLNADSFGDGKFKESDIEEYSEKDNMVTFICHHGTSSPSRMTISNWSE